MRGKPVLHYHGSEIFAAEAPLPLHVRLYHLNQDSPPHDHDYLEAVLICGGSGRHISAHGVQELQVGDVFLLRPGAWHTYADCRDLEVYNCCFSASLLRRELTAIAEEPTLHYLLVSGPLAPQAYGLLSFHLPPEEEMACRRFLDAAAERSPTDRESLADIARIAYLMLFLERLARNVPLPAGVTDTAPVAVHAAVREGVELLEGDPSRNWSLIELAAEVHLDPSYLTRLFTRVTGLSPMAYLGRVRAENAARLLLRTRLPIASIGAEVGWADPNYFARRFRAHFGLSPTAYRERMRVYTREPATFKG